MPLPMLLADALITSAAGFDLRISLPWIRSLPLASVVGVEVAVDGHAVPDLKAVMGSRLVPVKELPDETGWWFIQDRLEIRAQGGLDPGVRAVQVSLTLVIPYLSGGPDAPLTLPFHDERLLVLDQVRAPVVVVEPSQRQVLPQSAPWDISVSTFNWTPEVISAERTAADIAVDVVTGGVASLLEVEAGQLWRSFPVPTHAEVDAFGSALNRAGGRATLVGISLDEFTSQGRRRSRDELVEFILPQLRAASRLGAVGVRLPLGQAGPELLRLLQPALHDLDLILVEEAQGRQAPGADGLARAYEDIADLNDPRVRLLVDTSMFMPALPVTFLAQVRSGGLPDPLLGRLAHEWTRPETHDAVVEALREGLVPPGLHGLLMNLVVRFGRSQPAEVRDILPLVYGFHLKVWDLEDADGRVSLPISDLARVLTSQGWIGTLCSEWGGHEWLEASPKEITLAHLALLRTALAAGAVSA